MNEKNRAYYRQHDRGRYYFCGLVYTVCKGTRHAEKTSTAERKILFWYDPMYPNTRFDKRKSPFMDMDLVPKYADEEEFCVWCAH